MSLLVFPDIGIIKDHCSIDSDFFDHDRLLKQYENQAVAEFEKLTGRVLVAKTTTKELDGFPSDSSYIKLAPNLNSVASITYTDGAETEQTLATDQYDVKTWPLVGFVRLARDCYWPSVAYDIVITYDSGYGPPVRDQFIFDNSTARDAFFTTNPNLLVDGTWVITATVYQHYETDTWVDYPYEQLPRPIIGWLLNRISMAYMQREPVVIGAAVNEVPGFIDSVVDMYTVPEAA